MKGWQGIVAAGALTLAATGGTVATVQLLSDPAAVTVLEPGPVGGPDDHGLKDLELVEGDDCWYDPEECADPETRERLDREYADTPSAEVTTRDQVDAPTPGDGGTSLPAAKDDPEPSPEPGCPQGHDCAEWELQNSPGYGDPDAHDAPPSGGDHGYDDDPESWCGERGLVYGAGGCVERDPSGDE